jgi:hypothetical protein
MINDKVMKGQGLQSFFMSGSCAELHWKPLLKLLEQRILQAEGFQLDLIDRDKHLRSKYVKKYSGLVCEYFEKRTMDFVENVLKKNYGISDYYIRYEFAKSRGMIHFHMLVWREDMRPHSLYNSEDILAADLDGCGLDSLQTVLASWLKEIGMTANHPGTGQEEWPPPEGNMQNPRDDDCLCKIYLDLQGPESEKHNYIDSVNTEVYVACL